MEKLGKRITQLQHHAGGDHCRNWPSGRGDSQYGLHMGSGGSVAIGERGLWRRHGAELSSRVGLHGGEWTTSVQIQ